MLQNTCPRSGQLKQLLAFDPCMVGKAVHVQATHSMHNVQGNTNGAHDSGSNARVNVRTQSGERMA